MHPYRVVARRDAASANIRRTVVLSYLSKIARIIHSKQRVVGAIVRGPPPPPPLFYLARNIPLNSASRGNARVRERDIKRN